MVLPTADELRDATCVACPGQSLPLGRFDVTDRPGPAHPYDPTRGHRVHAATGVPTCVHPYRVGVPAAPYASAGTPLPSGPAPAPQPLRADLELPADPTLLEAWLIATIRATPAPVLSATLHRAERAALLHFPPPLVVTALRRALSAELSRGSGTITQGHR